MASAKAPEWRCRTCMKLLKGQMPRCAWCGEVWQNCYDSSYAPQSDMKRQKSASRPYQEQSSAAPWTDQQQQFSANWETGRTKSPRHKSRKQRGHGKGHQSEVYAPVQQPPVPHPAALVSPKGVGKQASGCAGPYPAALVPPPPPPLLMQSAPAITPVPVQTQAPTYAPMPAPPSEAEIRLKALLSALRKAPEDSLTPEVQAEMSKHAIKETKKTSKSVHSAVSDVERARKAIAEVESSRAKLMEDWKLFLQQSVVTWQEYTSMFQAQEYGLQERLIAAKQDLALARRDFKKKSQRLTEDEVQDISDEENPPAEEEMQDAAHQSEASKRLHEGKAPQEGVRRCGELYSFLTFAYINDAFWEARQCVTIAYNCRGPVLSHDEITHLRWQHRIVNEPDFRSPWTALQNAIDLAHQNGESAELKVETLSFGKPKRKHPRVTFSEAIHLVIENVETDVVHSNTVHESQLTQWSSKPWSLRPQQFQTSRPQEIHADPLSLAVSISDSCVEGNSNDAISLMQTAPPVQQVRSEVDAPAWMSIADQTIEAQAVRHHHPTAPHLAQAEEVMENDYADVQSTSSSSSWHVHQRVCLFHLDDPPVYGSIDWQDYELMMHEASVLLGIDGDQLLGLFDIAVKLHDFPDDVVPLIAYIAGDLDPGEPRSLALVDIEIHGNVGEPHYRTAPVVERTVFALPQTVDRQIVFMSVNVELYCTLEQDRCLLYYNHFPVFTQDNPRWQIRHGDHVRAVIPPPSLCTWPTQQLLDFRRNLADDDTNDGSMSPRSGYSPSLVPSEEIRAQYGHPAADEVAMFQTTVSLPASVEKPSGALDVTPSTCSFTEAFLRAVRVFQDAAGPIPEMPEDIPDDVSTFPPWIQELYDAWLRLARMGPGNVERLGRVETWFTDHHNFQRCWNSRVAVLAADFQNWESQLKRVWHDRLLPDVVIEFHPVFPMPEDAAGQTIGQIMIVQRPERFQRSLVVSTYDNMYDRGAPHSHALVMGDRVDLHAVRSSIEAVDDCPPEQPSNVCTLWFGNRQFETHERAYARHGNAFRFVIHRRSPETQDNMTDLVDHELRDSIQRMRGLQPIDPRIEHAVLAPDWFHAMQSMFDELSAVEREDEGPVAYINTWFLHGTHERRCRTSRAVRLRADVTAWQRTITDAWRDKHDTRYPIFFYWVDPVPPNPPTQSYIGHVILVQEPVAEFAAILLTGLARHDDHDVISHVAFYAFERLSKTSAVDNFPIPTPMRRFPHHVRRGRQIFPAHGSPRVGNGDNIIIEIDMQTGSPAAASSHQDAVHLLQTSVRSLRASQASEAVLPKRDRTTLHLADVLTPPAWTLVPCDRLAFLRQQLLDVCNPLACMLIDESWCR
eukprot:s1432_g10.t1